jgi:CubicO group peptidase (beta-lactamase class C family)
MEAILSTRLFLAVIFLATLPSPGVAQRWTLADTVQRQADGVFSFVDRSAPGCAVGISQEGMMAYGRGYGLANLDWEIPLSTSTVLDIGSVSKQFTATAVALLDMDGVLSLDDDVRRWIPELPDYGSTITIRHLLNHTSGIRDYLTLMELAGFDWANVFDEFDGVEIIARQKALNFEPGAEFLYSNSGYLLLANIVRRATGQSLRTFLEERVFDPLGMAHTSIWDDNTEILHERATGYSPSENGWAIDHAWNFQMGGDGQVITSVEDLLKWDENFFHPLVGGRPLLDRLHTQGVLNNGDTIDYALGLSLDEYRGLRRVQHGGAWAGFRAVIARFPDQHTSVIVLCNRGNANTTAYADGIADIILAGRFPEMPSTATERPDTAKISEPSQAQLRRWEGLYRRLDRPEYLRVRISEGQLSVGVGDTSYPLSPRSEDHFVLEGRGVSVWFYQDGETTKVRSGSDGRDVFERVEESRISDAPLREFEGRYESDELDAVFEVRVDGEGLALRRPNQDWVGMSPGIQDEFEAGGLGLTFVREGDAVSGIRVYAGRVTGIVFQRMGR